MSDCESEAIVSLGSAVILSYVLNGGLEVG